MPVGYHLNTLLSCDFGWLWMFAVLVLSTRWVGLRPHPPTLGQEAFTVCIPTGGDFVRHQLHTVPRTWQATLERTFLGHWCETWTLQAWMEPNQPSLLVISVSAQCSECFCSPSWYAETLNVMALGGGALGGDEVMRVEPRELDECSDMRECMSSPLSSHTVKIRGISSRWPGRERSPEWHPDLRLPGSRTMRSQFLLFLSPVACGTSLSHPS